MLEFEQINMDHSFILIKRDTPLSEIKSKLLQYGFVVITGEISYTIANHEYPMIASAHDSMLAYEWLEKVHWPPSPIFSEEQLREEEADWRRPILIENEKQEIIGIVTANIWIKKLHTETKRLTAYFETLAETVNDAVTAVDQEGKVICWNAAAERTYGIKSDEIIGRKIGDHFHAESVMLHRILSEGRPVRGEYHHPAADTHVLINASPIIQDNMIIGGVATEHDITQIVRLNEEIDASTPVLIHQERPFSSMIGESTQIKQAVQIAQKTAHADISVLLAGEPGSGKEMLAQAIHYGGPRGNGPFVSINCSAIPSGLLEAELFGYQGGPFTEEEQVGQAGKIEQAQEGTLFIAEIDQMPFDIQVKFLNYLENQSFYRVGGMEVVNARTRIIAAASSAIEEMVQEGKFHKDLYYHLTVIKIDIPPLRERKEDIEGLVENFIQELAVKYRKSMPDISPEAKEALLSYEWPGNIRELRNVVERFILLNEGDVVTLEHLPQNMTSDYSAKNSRPLSNGTLSKGREPGKEEALTIEEALKKTYGNKSAAAKLLGISRGTLYNKIREYDL
ncbi:sigma-54 interaction domain-containing protein [Priestia abyssalis]|uniref:sigma-54 interaction domain-containing protein n=1 Tax=Priestia abyssalis TaxID=1221450 RepID=UPI001117014C|nr:sigma 54-interacting transcriptional regulator [Priestia abyssalis]